LKRMIIEERFKQKKDAVERELESILSRGNSLLFQAMRYSVLSAGKRYRPLLMLASGDYFHVEMERILPFACALELIHNYSLVHDDLPCMDNDDYRRGRPACHKVYGEDIALLTGDSLLSLAFEVMAEVPDGKDFSQRKSRAIREISHFAGVEGLIGGQLLDITYNPEEISEDRLMELMIKKTGGLITASVTAGGILGGASSRQIGALHAYGENVGLAFQIRDDIQDAAKDYPDNSPPRPNCVHFFGPDKAREKLDDHIQDALIALEKASIDSEELRHLAIKLSVLKEKIENEQIT